MSIIMEQVWMEICSLDEIPVLGARVVQQSGKQKVALFRNQQDEVFAVDDRCPHKGGPLSQGIVFGSRVACPLHNWVIELETGEALAPDKGCTHRYSTKVESGRVWILW